MFKCNSWKAQEVIERPRVSLVRLLSFYHSRGPVYAGNVPSPAKTCKVLAWTRSERV